MAATEAIHFLSSVQLECGPRSAVGTSRTTPLVSFGTPQPRLVQWRAGARRMSVPSLTGGAGR